MPTEIARNSPCPCGSGKKYKNCCCRRQLGWVQDEEGQILRRVPVSEESVEILRGLFVATHGREPGAGDRLCDGAPPLEWIEHQTVEAMKKAEIDPAIIHAYEQTGLLLSVQNEPKCTTMDVEEWEAAIDAYERKTDTKAARRRLTDADLAAILANGPK
jgi:hypothetical protein